MPSEVRVLTLWQPWAQLMADGRKRIETRSWSTKYRGWMAIHAARAFPGEARRKAIELGYDEVKGTVWTSTALRFGVIVALVHLDDVVLTHEAIPRVSNEEIRYGNYEHGRYAWFTSSRREVDPVEYKGGQGLRRLPESVWARWFQ